MIAFLAFAAAATASPDCRHAVAQSDMTMCAGRDAARADDALNRQWTATLRAMREADAHGPSGQPGPGYAAALLTSQRAWLAYRDAQCVIEGYEMRGGSAEPMVHAACLASLADARTRQLRSLLWTR